MGFWIAATGMTIVVTALFVLALRRGGAQSAPAAAYDLQVYRDQLREVARDEERGAIGGADAERLRIEVSRRVLEADRGLAGTGALARAPRRMTLAASVLIAAVLGGSLALYDRVGAPGYPDLPITARIAQAEQMRKERPSQAAAEAKVAPRPAPKLDAAYVDLMTKLRDAVARNPDDLQGQQLLTRNEAGIGNYSAAWKAQAAVIRLLGDKASAQDYAGLAGLMVLAVDGYVSPEAEKALTETLRRDPKNGTARYYSGLMFAQNDRPDLAFRLWQPLLAESAPDAPWVAPIRGQIEEIAAMAGIPYSLPEAKGPNAADVANAAQMSPEDRQQMIRGMVAQLADRLDRQGGTVEEWAKLIKAYGVLGEAEKAQTATAKAEAALAGSPDALAKLKAALAGPAPADGAPALAGPSAEDVQAAGQMSASDRQQMIRGMVQKLSDRLAAQGGSPAEWAQLIGAYGVLGETEKARAIWTEAQSTFAGHDADLATIRAAAKSAGVAE